MEFEGGKSKPLSKKLSSTFFLRDLMGAPHFQKFRATEK